MDRSYRAEAWIFLFLFAVWIVYYALSNNGGDLYNLLSVAVYVGFGMLILAVIITLFRSRDQPLRP